MRRLRDLLTKKRGKTGFTLVELLVTITLIGIISLTTFAIMISAMNTFKRQQDVTEASATKDMICEELRDMLRKKVNFVLVDNRKFPSDVIVREGHGDKYAIDENLKKNHLLFSKDGRVYVTETNTRGRYLADINGVPLMATETDPGMTAVFDERVYNGYNVDLTFTPMKSIKNSMYCVLRIEIKVIDPKKSEVVVDTSETFELINMLNKSKEIDHLKESLPAGQTNETYHYCYFS